MRTPFRSAVPAPRTEIPDVPATAKKVDGGNGTTPTRRVPQSVHPSSPSVPGESRTRASPVRDSSGSGRSTSRRGGPRPSDRRAGWTDRSASAIGRRPARRPEVYRRRRVLAALVTVVALVGGGIGVEVVLFHTHLFDVGRVVATGTVSVTSADVLAAAAVPTAVPLAGVDTQAVADRVAALPAIASAHVSLAWPHTVAITVVERSPVATVTAVGGVQLVDGSGAVFPGSPPPGLPMLTMSGVGPGDPATSAALAALAAFPTAVRPQVQTVGATLSGPGAPGDVTFGLSGDRQVVWGAPERGTDKAAVLVPLLTQKGHVFDVSSPDLPTVRR